MSRMGGAIRSKDALNKGVFDNGDSAHLRERVEQRIPQTPQEVDEFIANNVCLIHAVVRPYRGLLEDEDLFQEACIGAIKGINTFNPRKEVNFTTYVYVCAANEVKMAIRKTSAQKRSGIVVPIDFGPSDRMTDEYKPVAIPDPNTDVEKDALDRVLYDKIMGVIRAKLTKTEQIIVLQYRDGVPQSRTGKQLNISQSQVSKILNQAFCKIKSGIYLSVATDMDP